MVVFQNSEPQSGGGLHLLQLFLSFTSDVLLSHMTLSQFPHLVKYQREMQQTAVMGINYQLFASKPLLKYVNDNWMIGIQYQPPVPH